MMLRVLQYDHTYDNALGIALQKGIMTTKQIKGDPIATRGDVVNMTYKTWQLLEEQRAALESDMGQETTTSSAYEAIENADSTSESSQLPENIENVSGNTPDAIEDENASEPNTEKEDETTEQQTLPL